MAVQDDLREHMPAVAALVDILDALDARSSTATAGTDIAALVEALAAHQKRGGQVPWNR